MDDTSPSIRRMCVAISRARGRGHDTVSGQARLRETIANACAQGPLERIIWNAPTGDERELGLFPVGIDEPRTLATFVRALLDAVNAANASTTERLRLLVGVYEGITTLCADRYRGQAADWAVRLLKTRALHAALARSGWADMALILSDRVVGDVRQLGLPNVHAGPPHRVEIIDADTRHSELAWIFVPTIGPGPADGSGASPASDRES